MRRVVLLFVSLGAAVLAPNAFAHANVVSTSPRDGAILATAPREVRVRFDDPVRVGPGNAAVANGGGSVVAGRVRVAGKRELVLPLQRLAPGDYSVRWRIVSDDGHLEGGVLAFRVGSQLASGGPQSALRVESSRPSAIEVVSRWLYLGGILVAGGTGLFLFLVSRLTPGRAATTFTAALVIVVLAGLSLLHATHAGGTRFGHVTGVAVLVAAGGVAAAALSTLYPRLLTVAAAASLALLAAPSVGGHALDAGQPSVLSFTADLVHVASAAFWIGGLLQLTLLLRSGAGTSAARRFSMLALPSVALIALAGAGRALTELSAVSQLWSTGYGQAILVKSALFAAVVGLAWVSRRRLDSALRLLPSVSSELALLALLVGVVGVLTALRPGRDATAGPLPIVPRELARPTATPAGSVVLARQSRELAVALAVRPGPPLRLTATILGQLGNGVDGLDVELSVRAANHGASRPARRCGPGCYAATLPFAAPELFAVNITGSGPPRSVRFLLAPLPRPEGETFLARATSAFRTLRTAVFTERLASGPKPGIFTTWKLAAPDRLEYEIRGGAGGIVIGQTRWDRPSPGAAWKRSQTTLLPQPSVPWGSRTANAHVLRETRRRVIVSWVDPGVPAWFTATFDRRTALPIELRMTAAAHFMRHRYLAFDREVRIEPPL